MASAREVDVAFISVSTESSTEQFIEQIKQNNNNLRCVFVKLTQQDLQSFEAKDRFDAVVLLHSISQGRNSITDVADAKYGKLLPQLKKKYGPDRVAVVVHSLTSFNPDTKMALMMVFKKSQPTTFKCSNCVIQCNNPSQMVDDDLSRLSDFLARAPDHPFPEPKIEAPPKKDPPTSSIKASSTAAKVGRKRTGSSPEGGTGSHDTTKALAMENSKSTSNAMSAKKESIPKKDHIEPKKDTGLSNSGDSVKDPLRNPGPPEYPPHQASANDLPMKNNTPVEHGNRQFDREMPDTSQTGASYPQQPLPQDHLMEDRYLHVAKDKVIDTTYPLALVSPICEPLKNVLSHYLPQKTIMTVRQPNELEGNWHLFETVLLDFGRITMGDIPSDYIALLQKIRKKMSVADNVGVFMNFPATIPPTALKENIGQLQKTYGIQAFPYGNVPNKSTAFDEWTVNRLVSWLLVCYQRFDESVKKARSGYFESFIENVKSIKMKISNTFK